VPFRIKPRNSRVIGIDVGRQTVRLMQHAAAGPPITAHASVRGEHRCESDAYRAAALDAVQRGLDAGGFAGRSVVVSLPTAVLRVKSVRLPEMPAHEIAEAIKWESDGTTATADETIRQHVTLGSVRQGDESRQEVLLLSADRRWVEGFVDDLDGLGLELVRIDVAASGVAQALPVTPRPQLILDLGADSTRAMIVEQGSLRFYKEIGPGQIELDRLVADSLRLPLGDAGEARRRATEDPSAARGVQEALRAPVEALGQELSLCVRYFCVSFRGARPEHGLAVGGGATYDTLVSDLATASGIGLEAFDPFAGRPMPHPPDRPWAWAQAAGLANDAAPAAGKEAA
jgi:type IV pilus assembly protein PilM